MRVCYGLLDAGYQTPSVGTLFARADTSRSLVADICLCVCMRICLCGCLLDVCIEQDVLRVSQSLHCGFYTTLTRCAVRT